MIAAVRSAELIGAITLLMVLRDMGNGVIRVETARLLEHFENLSHGFADVFPLFFPLTPRMQDCVDVSMELVGADPSRPFREGRMRSVCDRVTEVWMW